MPLPRRGLLALLALGFCVLSGETASAQEGRPPAGPARSAMDPATKRGVPALFSWADVDGDGRLDLAAVSGDGTLQLLFNAGDGRFEDATEGVGLASVGNAALALWADYDNDGRQDLFVGAREGASRLFHNEDAVFIDMSAGSGLVSEGAVQSAEWLDLDGDGRPDLFVVLSEKSQLFRGLEGGFFELAELPLAGLGSAPALGGSLAGEMAEDVPRVDTGGPGTPSAPGLSGEKGGLRPGGSISGSVSVDGASVSGGRMNLGPTPSVGSVTPIAHFPTACADSIRDQANPSTCIAASTTPTLGRLYPISANLFVATGGNVGIGTTSPVATLDVAGTARITDTLTLAPSGDTALDVSTGSIYKGGALFIHTKGTANNTAIGEQALGTVTAGSQNTASGRRALFLNTTGSRNTASGYAALRDNTTGGNNTATGSATLSRNTAGGSNTACGYGALNSNTTGNSNTATGALVLKLNTTGDGNTASGLEALLYNSTGSFNIATGFWALRFNTTGSRNTANGSRALRNNTTGNQNTANGYGALLVNSTGNGNTACGYRALFSNTSSNNTASGFEALFSNTTGGTNTAFGHQALTANTAGYDNTAGGYRALFSNTTGFRNTAVGRGALGGNTTGDFNIAVGIGAGGSLTTGDNNIVIGSNGAAGEGGTIRIGNVAQHARAFIAGIRGVTTGVANAIPVLIDSAGQLGTVSSSRRFKKDIADMGDLTDRLLELRPVVFHYKQEQKVPGGGEVPLEYGLIAEEVAEIFPDLVVYDEEGQPFTVKYHLLSAMLLNELKKLTATHVREMEELRSRLAAVEARTSQPTAPAALR